MMLYGFQVRVVFSVLLTLIPHCANEKLQKRTKLTESESRNFQERVGDMLGFKNYPTLQHVDENKNYDISREAPKYMLDLYEKHKYSAVQKGNERGNTVRLIYGTIGDVNKNRMFVFNLSSVMATEKVFSAEVHLYKKEMKKGKTDIEVMIYQISPVYVSQIGKDRLARESYGWQTLDATEAVKRCLKSRKRYNLLGIYFRNVDSSAQIRLKKFERRHSRPFLVIYSNDTQNITADHIQPRFTPRDLVSLEKHLKRTGYQGDEASDEGTYRQDLLEAKDLEPFTEGKVNSDNGTLGVFERYEADRRAALVAKKRNKRSILDNEIPQFGEKEKVTAIILPMSPGSINFPKPSDITFPKTNPGILRGRERQRGSDDLDKYSTKKPNRQLIPFPKDYLKEQRRRRRRNRRRNRKKSYRRRFDDSLWDDSNINAATGRASSDLCQKRHLSVNFADIGWNQWIINPKSFDTHYCAGTCPFPLTRSMKPSNHATIQSILHAIGLHSNVPEPCCVPDTMSSVTLLFFDENQNVVLKNYPGMSVESCACR